MKPGNQPVGMVLIPATGIEITRMQDEGVIFKLGLWFFKCTRQTFE